MLRVKDLSPISLEILDDFYDALGRIHFLSLLPGVASTLPNLAGGLFVYKKQFRTSVRHLTR